MHTPYIADMVVRDLFCFCLFVCCFLGVFWSGEVVLFGCFCLFYLLEGLMRVLPFISMCLSQTSGDKAITFNPGITPDEYIYSGA